MDLAICLNVTAARWLKEHLAQSDPNHVHTVTNQPRHRGETIQSSRRPFLLHLSQASSSKVLTSVADKVSNDDGADSVLTSDKVSSYPQSKGSPFIKFTSLRPLHQDVQSPSISKASEGSGEEDDEAGRLERRDASTVPDQDAGALC